jgi:Flp pilus assembly protein TadD
MTARLFSATIIAFGLGLSSALAMGSGGGGGSLSGPVGDSPGDQTRQQYKKAVKAIEQKDFATAEALLTAYLAKRKKSAEAWNYLAYAQRNLGKHEDAMANYTTALGLDPKHKGALEYQGELFLILSNVDAAVANLDRLSALCKKKKKCEERDVLQASIERAKDGKTSWLAPGRSPNPG